MKLLEPHSKATWKIVKTIHKVTTMSLKYVIILSLLFSISCSPINNAASSGKSVDSSFSDNNTTFVITVSEGEYSIDGFQRKTLNLRRGYTYNFDAQDSSTNNHPLYLGKVSTTTGYSDEYINGVTNSRTTNQILTFKVPDNSPTTLYYKCGLHKYMGGQIMIVNWCQ